MAAINDNLSIDRNESETSVHDFKKSSFCAGGGCVEVAITNKDAIYIRDTKDAAQNALQFTTEEWREFVAGVKAGEFDLT